MTLIGNRLLINQLRERILREEKGSIVVEVVVAVSPDIRKERGFDKLNDYCMRIRSQSLCKRNLILNFLCPTRFVPLFLLITKVFTQSLKRNHQSSICSRYIEPTAGSLHSLASQKHTPPSLLPSPPSLAP